MNEENNPLWQRPSRVIDCSCGRTHRVEIERIDNGSGAIHNLPRLLTEVVGTPQTEVNRAGPIYLVSDRNTDEAAGREVERLLKRAGFEVIPILLEENPGKEKISPTPARLYQILEPLREPGFILGCGAGTISDLVKFAADRANLKSGMVATAPSMDGYSSGVASLVVDGVKKTLPAGPHSLIVADSQILSQAPKSLIRAGLGDILGKVTSLLDWHLRRIIWGDYYCHKAEELIMEPLQNLLDGEEGSSPDESGSRELRNLSRGLINSGLAILLAGGSEPASGSEHHISHYLEMLGLRDGISTPLHGHKVGLGTYFSSNFYLKLYERLEELNFPLKIEDDREDRSERIEYAYGKRKGPVLATLEERWPREKSFEISAEQAERLAEKIEEFLPLLQSAQKFLERSSFLKAPEVKKLQTDQLRRAALYGFEIRNRYTVAVLFYQLGWLEEMVEECIGDLMQKHRGG